MLTLLLAAVVSGVLYMGRRNEGADATRSGVVHHAEASNSLPAVSVSTNTSSPLQQLTQLMASLAHSRTPQDSKLLLAKLRTYCASLEPAVASQAIRELLDAHEDAPTHLGFIIGPKGVLLEVPSGRVFLLDLLAQVDRPAGAAYAEKILGTMASSDEWALALRNYALVNTTAGGKSFLEEKMNTLLRYEAWQNEPSTGYLEAFDVAVYLGGTNLMPALTSLARQTENRPISHAAYLALDRLTIANPAQVLDALQSQPEMMKGRETTCANFFARANVDDETQRNILEKYLLDSRRTASELNTFAGLFPNANYMISPNLLTQTVTPDRDTLALQDRRALQVVQGWLQDARFQKLTPQLQTMKSRLEIFVNQTQPGR